MTFTASHAIEFGFCIVFMATVANKKVLLWCTSKQNPTFEMDEMDEKEVPSTRLGFGDDDVSTG